jgi:hypothetical protein
MQWLVYGPFYALLVGWWWYRRKNPGVLEKLYVAEAKRA